MIGEVTTAADVVFTRGNTMVAKLTIAEAERAWKQPLDLDGTLLPEASR